MRPELLTELWFWAVLGLCERVGEGGGGVKRLHCRESTPPTRLHIDPAVQQQQHNNSHFQPLQQLEHILVSVLSHTHTERKTAPTIYTLSKMIHDQKHKWHR